MSTWQTQRRTLVKQPLLRAEPSDNMAAFWSYSQWLAFLGALLVHQKVTGQDYYGYDNYAVTTPHSGVDDGQPGECRLSFTLPPDAIRNLCRPQELENLISELRQQRQDAAREKAELKESIKSIRDDYSSMVEKVERLERETASWREIVEWPVFDDKFRPNNDTMLIDESKTYLDCYEAFGMGQDKQGIYTLKPSGAQKPFFAYCEAEGWTVIMRRFDGETDFFRGWSDYSGGFGELTGEFWLGLEQIHLLTRDEMHEVVVEILGWNNKLYKARHPGFMVDSELSDYELHIGNMTEGNYQDEFGQLNGLKFTTRDRDNDLWRSNNCADYYNGAWWLQNCGWDPNRRWCNGRGCMMYGDVNAKKMVIKIRSMGDLTSAAKRPRPSDVKLKKEKKRGRGRKPKTG